MGHKKSTFLLGLSFLAVAIVVPLAHGVNHLTQSLVQVADGNPGPPLPPPTDLVSPAAVEPIVVADSNPCPPSAPPTTVENQIATNQILIADGNPGPPLPPPTERV